MSQSAPNASAAAAGPDAAQLALEPLERGTFPGKSPAALRLCIDPAVHEQIHRHARADTSIEVCGVLVGAWKQDDSGPFVHVTASIQGEAAASKIAEVTFTHETWARINQRMDREFSKLAIVGWYHTHPDFGIFLSERDVFIHQHFFGACGQVALVIDPIRKLEGVFIWEAGKPVLAPVHWVGTKALIHPAAAETRTPSPGSPTGAAGEGSMTPLRSEPAPVPPSRTALFAAAIVGLVACGYFLARLEARRDTLLVAQALLTQLTNRTSSLETFQALEEVREAMKQLEARAAGIKNQDKEAAASLAAAIDEASRRTRSAADRGLASISLRPEQQMAIEAILSGYLQSMRSKAAPGDSRPKEDSTVPAAKPASSAPVTPAPAATPREVQPKGGG